jgi:ribosomal protein S12 methylthiotransferase accessory factor YcaO
MYNELLDLSFRTLVTELGIGTQCTSTIPIRTSFSELEPEFFSGAGFSTNPLLARFAAEGEMLERATWRAGILWNNVYLPDELCQIPEEAQLLLSTKNFERLSTKPCTAIRVIHHDKHQSWIPSEVVFHTPKLAQNIKHNSATTGWAYHVTKEMAAAQGYREVIERDLQMLFWFGKLKPFLSRIPINQLQQWYADFAVDTKNVIKVLQLKVNIASCFGDTAYFTLVIYVSDDEPYLSIGSSLKIDAKQSFLNAMGECIMLRSHQYEEFIKGVKQASDNSYNAHAIRATRKTEMRDKVLTLFATSNDVDSLSDSRLDYSKLNYQIAYLQPPPVINHGTVAKVWVEGCQNMVPAGFPYDVTKRWQNSWGINNKQWKENRWHPYP